MESCNCHVLGTAQALTEIRAPIVLGAAYTTSKKQPLPKKVQSEKRTVGRGNGDTGLGCD